MMTDPAIAEMLEPEGDVAEGDYPIPAGWRILIEPIKIEATTASGIALPQESVQAKEHLRYIGKVVSMGDLCYQHAKFMGADKAALKWCKVGDFVAYGAYAGQEIQVRNRTRDGLVTLKLINDDEILAVVPNPMSVHIYC